MPSKRHNVPLNVYGGGSANFRSKTKNPVSGMFTDMHEDLKSEHVGKQLKIDGVKHHHVRQGFKHHKSTFEA